MRTTSDPERPRSWRARPAVAAAIAVGVFLVAGIVLWAVAGALGLSGAPLALVALGGAVILAGAAFVGQRR